MPDRKKHNEIIGEFFDSNSDFWEIVYYRDFLDIHPKYRSLIFREQHFYELIKDTPRGVVLDLGCGSGHFLIRLAERGFDKIIGVDISGELIEKAKSAVESAGLDEKIHLISSDVENLSYIADSSVDVVTGLGLIEYLQTDELLIKEIHRVLKSGGIGVIQTRNSRCVPASIKMAIKKILGRREPIWFRRHNPKRFKDLLRRSGFEIVDERYSHFYPLFLFSEIPFFKKLITKRLISMSNKAEENFSAKSACRKASMFIVKFRKL
ncbi:methyltransferase domain-containing protein [bacterium]|nr:methyltransferase domain-containing protein [bacterium]